MLDQKKRVNEILQAYEITNQVVTQKCGLRSNACSQYHPCFLTCDVAQDKRPLWIKKSVWSLRLLLWQPRGYQQERRLELVRQMPDNSEPAAAQNRQSRCSGRFAFRLPGCWLLYFM